jgi:hypothetical protein
MMRLYKVSYLDINAGMVTAWAGTQLDAKAVQKDMRARRVGADEPKIEEIDFPTDKPGLLAYINEHFVRDNG